MAVSASLVYLKSQSTERYCCLAKKFGCWRETHQKNFINVRYVLRRAHESRNHGFEPVVSKGGYQNRITDLIDELFTPPSSHQAILCKRYRFFRAVYNKLPQHTKTVPIAGICKLVLVYKQNTPKGTTTILCFFCLGDGTRDATFIESFLLPTKKKPLETQHTEHTTTTTISTRLVIVIVIRRISIPIMVFTKT